MRDTTKQHCPHEPIKLLRRNEWQTPRGRPTNKGTNMQNRQTPHSKHRPPCQSKTSNEMNGQSIRPLAAETHTKTMPTRHAPTSLADRISRPVCVQEKNRKPHPSSRNRRPYHLIMYLSKLKYIKSVPNYCAFYFTV